MKARLWFLCAVAIPSVALALQAVLPTTDADASSLALQVWDLVVNKHYALVLGPAVSLIVYALRRFDILIPKYGPQVDAFLNQPIVAFLLPTAVSAAGGIGTALAAHQPVSAALRPVLEAATSAVFLFVGVKKSVEAVPAAPAPEVKP